MVKEQTVHSRSSPTFDLFGRIEPLLVFLVFYLPGYLAQTTPISGKIFNSVSFNVTYLITVLPRVVLLLYLMLLRTRIEESGAEPAAILREYGVVRLRSRDLAWIVLTFLAIEAVVVPLSMIASTLSGSLGSHAGAGLPAAVHWRLTRPAMLPLVFLTTMAIGYSEELYFRSYLLTVLPRMGVGIIAAVVASTALFALGHFYEGLPGLLGTIAIGVILSLLFLWKRNLHVIAIGHGLYNFVTLLATLSLPGVGR